MLTTRFSHALDIYCLYRRVAPSLKRCRVSHLSESLSISYIHIYTKLVIINTHNMYNIYNASFSTGAVYFIMPYARGGHNTAREAHASLARHWCDHARYKIPFNNC
jgi:hypothetical protein